MCLTVDWEGEHLKNVQDLISTRKMIGREIPLTHFICPNYFTSKNTRSKNAEIIKTAIYQNDEVGLHIHCFEDLINEIATIPFRTNHNYHNLPNWIERKLIKKIWPRYNRKITGRGVPLSVYSTHEIHKIIHFSRKLLCQYLSINEPIGFRAGGWIANDTILSIVQKLEFAYDSSAVAPVILSKHFSDKHSGNKRDNYGRKNGLFTEHIINLWGSKKQEVSFLKNDNINHYMDNKPIEIHTQPFYIDQLIEIPNNCGLSDFCSPDKTIIPLIKSYLKQLSQDPEKSFLIVYGCHQEGDIHYKSRLIDLMYSLNELKTDAIEFITMKDVLNLDLIKRGPKQ